MNNVFKVASYLLAFFLASTGFLAAQQNIPFTSIQDTLNNPDGTPFSGTLYITWPTYQVGNVTVAAGKQSVLVANGALSVSLTPTDKMTPQGTFYTVSYVTNAGNPVSTFWSVPTNSAPITLSKIQPVVVSGGGGSGGLAPPAAAGLMKYTGANTTAPATPNDVLNLFTGPQSSNSYLAGDGTLKPFPNIPTIPVSGVVKSTGSTLAPALPADIMSPFSNSPTPGTYFAGDGTLKPFPTIPTVPAAGVVKSTGSTLAPALPADILSPFSNSPVPGTYFAGDGTLKPFPTIPTLPTTVSSFANDAKYISSGANSIFSGFMASLKSTSVTNLVVIGDSTNSCTQVTCAATTPPYTGLGPNSTYNTPPAILARNLSSGGSNSHGSGIVPIFAQNSGAMRTDFWSLVGGSTSNTVPFGPYMTAAMGGYNPFGSTMSLSGAGNYLNFTGYGDSVTIYGANYTDSGSGCTVTVDGIATSAFQPGTSANYTAVKQTYPISTGSGVSHTIRLIGPPSGKCYVYGGEWTVGNQGLSVHNLARGGAATIAFGGDVTNQLAYLSLINGGIQMAIIDLGLNDLNSNVSTTATNYQTYIQNIVTSLRAINPTVPILMVNPWLSNISGSSSLTGAQLRSSVQTIVANNTNVALLDMTPRWVSASAALNNGLTVAGDGTHETDAGAQDFANAMAQAITGAAPYAASSSFNGAQTGDLNVSGSVVAGGVTTKALTINSPSSTSTTLSFANSGAGTGFRPYQIQSTSSGSGVGPGSLLFYDPSNFAGPLAISPSGSFYNVSVRSGDQFAFSGTNNAVTGIDTWLGRNSAGLLYINGPSGAAYVVTRPTAAPATSSSNCLVGQVFADTAYIYACNAPNHWVRTAAASF